MRAVAIAAALLVSGQAGAQGNCGDRMGMVENLAEKYGERFAGGGLRNAEAIFEVWASDKTGTWTILLTLPDGTACVMASGTDWRRPLPAGIEG